MLKLGSVGCLSSTRVSFSPEPAGKFSVTVAGVPSVVPLRDPAVCCSFLTLYWNEYGPGALAVAWNEPSGLSFSVRPAVTFCNVVKSTLSGKPLGSTSFSKTPGELIERYCALVAVKPSLFTIGFLPSTQVDAPCEA